MVGLSFESLPFEDTQFWLVPIWVPQCERQRYFPQKRRFNLQTYVCKQADACISPAKEGPLLLRSYNHTNYILYNCIWYIYIIYYNIHIYPQVPACVLCMKEPRNELSPPAGGGATRGSFPGEGSASYGSIYVMHLLLLGVVVICCFCSSWFSFPLSSLICR